VVSVAVPTSPAAHSTFLIPSLSASPERQIRAFAVYLREHGFVLGLAELTAMIDITARADIEDPDQVQAFWRGIACSNQKQWRQFPDLFDAFWFAHRRKGKVKSSERKRQGKQLHELVQELQGQGNNMPTDQQAGTLGLGSEGQGAEPESERGQGGASATDPLLHKPLGEWLPHDSEQLDRYIEPLQARLRRRLIQHYRRAPHASRIDLRQSIRKAMGTAGELVCLQKRARQSVMPNVYILVDVSQSMETHAQFFLRMARSFCQIMQARAFVFHTGLIEVTDLLRRNSGRVQEKINAVTFGFGGGTRIASSLSAFMTTARRGSHGQRIRGLSRRDVVLVLSDGFDTDPPDQLPEAVGAIRRAGAHLYWLHPTVDRPQSRAIEACGSSISGFLGISHLDSLENLVDLLANKPQYDKDGTTGSGEDKGSGQ
jgi:uncharacterized protein with von Willebrand factor type A (vWA) domain